MKLLEAGKPSSLCLFPTNPRPKARIFLPKQPSLEERPIQWIEHSASLDQFLLRKKTTLTQDPFGPNTHFHHLTFEKRRRELQTLLGKALRLSMGQRLPARLHFNKYKGSLHYLLSQPIDIPTTPFEQNQTVVLNLGKAISRKAVQFIDGVAVDRILTPAEHAFISLPEITHVDSIYRSRPDFNRHRIGRALVAHSVETFMLDIASEKQASRFLKSYESEDSVRLAELSNLLIRNCLDESISAVVPIYERAKEHGMVADQTYSLRKRVRSFIPEHEHSAHYSNMARILNSKRQDRIGLA